MGREQARKEQETFHEPAATRGRDLLDRGNPALTLGATIEVSALHLIREGMAAARLDGANSVVANPAAGRFRGSKRELLVRRNLTLNPTRR